MSKRSQYYLVTTFETFDNIFNHKIFSNAYELWNQFQHPRHVLWHISIKVLAIPFSFFSEKIMPLVVATIMIEPWSRFLFARKLDVVGWLLSPQTGLVSSLPNKAFIVNLRYMIWFQAYYVSYKNTLILLQLKLYVNYLIKYLIVWNSRFCHDYFRRS